MRVTFSELNRHMQEVLDDRYTDLSNLQEQLATGKRLSQPSDDPVDVANDMKMRSTVANLDQKHNNLDDGKGFMSVTDTAMMSMNDIMQRLRELAIQGASDTQTGTERAYIAQEVEQLTRQMISLTNTVYKGDYVFAGTQTKIMPFPLDTSKAATQLDYTNLSMAYFNASAGAGVPVQIRNSFDNSAITNIIPGSFKLVAPDAAGNPKEWVEGTDYTVDYAAGTITVLATGTDPAALTKDVSDGGTFAGPNYSPNGFQLTFDYVSKGKDIYGDTVETNGDVLREIEPGVTTPINITGDELTNDPKTGTNLINVLLNFGQNLLQNNTQGIQAAISGIDAANQQILASEAKNGARENTFTTTERRNEGETTDATAEQSKLEDADLAKTITDFNLTQNVYTAALKSAASVIKPSLVDYL